MNESFSSRRNTLSFLWSRLCEPGTAVGLATVSDDGAAVRTVILRSADPDKSVVTIHTNALSRKVSDLSADPRAQLLFWDDTARLQARLSVSIRMSVLPSEEWADLPEASKRLYGRDPAPGTPLRAPTVTPSPDPSLFTELTASIVRIETLHLGRDYHRRAIFLPGDGWRGQWIAP